MEFNYNNSSDHNFSDLDKESDASTLTNLDMTVVTINYRVKDGWDNFSDPMARTVYIYESAQYSMPFMRHLLLISMVLPLKTMTIMEAQIIHL